MQIKIKVEKEFLKGSYFAIFLFILDLVGYPDVEPFLVSGSSLVGVRSSFRLLSLFTGRVSIFVSKSASFDTLDCSVSDWVEGIACEFTRVVLLTKTLSSRIKGREGVDGSLTTDLAGGGES